MLRSISTSTGQIEIAGHSRQCNSLTQGTKSYKCVTGQCRPTKISRRIVCRPSSPRDYERAMTRDLAAALNDVAVEQAPSSAVALVLLMSDKHNGIRCRYWVFKQEAQLSQTDRATLYVTFGSKPLRKVKK